MPASKKILDTSENITSGSRLDKYWQGRGFDNYVGFVRPNLKLPNNLNFNANIALIQNSLAIKEIGFGNWVTNEDRFNYLNSLVVAVYDLNKVVNFDFQIGLNKLAVSFGARGVGSALAHYEPTTKIINITRYARGNEDKIARFIGTGGMGSFAHEYGHYLDYFAGEYLAPNSDVFAVTGGRSLSTKRIKSGDGKQALRTIANDILEKIIWAKPNEKLSPYYTRLKKIVEDLDTMGDYYLRRNEMFARWFEAWVSYKLKTMGIRNRLLAQYKYNPSIYPTENELSSVSKLFEAFCKEFRSAVFA